MLQVWGIYLEDNPNKLKTGLSAEECAKLKKPALRALNVTSLSQGWTAPRCHMATLKEKAGPLRCSMARLSWEYCSGSWGKVSLAQLKSSRRRRRSLTVSSSTTSASLLAYATDMSFIHSVHPSLLSP